MSTVQEFVKAAERAAYNQPMYRVFSDFCELSVISLLNRLELNQEKHDKRETRYTAILDAYRPEERKQFPEMFALTVLALEDRYQDFLGSVFHELNLHAHFKGQFFTPYHLCRATASVNLNPDWVKSVVEENGVLRMLEPASGAGAMIIATAECLKEQGFDFQNCLYVHAVDVDVRACHMTYIQLSLLGVPALITHGNSLSLEAWDQFYTPAYWMSMVPWKLHRLRRTEGAPEGGANNPSPAADVTLLESQDAYGQLSINF